MSCTKNFNNFRASPIAYEIIRTSISCGQQGPRQHVKGRGGGGGGDEREKRGVAVASRVRLTRGLGKCRKEEKEVYGRKQQRGYSRVARRK